jgi:hypothetical protein
MLLFYSELFRHGTRSTAPLFAERVIASVTAEP